MEKNEEPRNPGLQEEEEEKRTWSSERDDSLSRGWEQRDPGSWVCASRRKGNTGLPQSRRQFRGRSPFMRKWHITGCPAEEEKREGELRSRKASAFHIRMSCPLTEAGSPNKLCLTQVTGCTWKWSWFRLTQKKVVAGIPATPIMPCKKRKIQQKTQNMAVGLRITTDWQCSGQLLEDGT